MKRSDGTNSIFSGAPRRPKSKSGVELLNFMSAFWTLLALARTGETNESTTLRTVKSFAVLSLRERSSGNSEAQIAHSSTLTNATSRILTVLIR